MGKIEFQLWANEQGVFAAVLCITASILAAAGQFTRWDCGLAGGVLSVIALALEWPRPARARGRVDQRPLQGPFTSLVSHLGAFGRSYYVRFVLYLVISMPSCICLPTLIPAIMYFSCALTYLVAAIRGEHWRPIVTEVKRRKTQFDEIKMPTRPPPRITADSNVSSVLSRPSFLSRAQSYISQRRTQHSPNPSQVSNQGFVQNFDRDSVDSFESRSTTDVQPNEPSASTAVHQSAQRTSRVSFAKSDSIIGE